MLLTASSEEGTREGSLTFVPLLSPSPHILGISEEMLGTSAKQRPAPMIVGQEYGPMINDMRHSRSG